jgi:glycosyltransferase involved in cell wall biosynthesis
MTLKHEKNFTGQERRVLVAIPSYNDFELIETISDQVREIIPEATILIVDDGSDRELSRAASKMRILYTRLPSNYGLGMCMNVAFDHFLEYRYDIFVRLDADGQHPVERLADLIAPIKQDKADFVIGSRTNRDSSRDIRSLLSICVREYMAMLVRITSNKSMPSDVTSGFFAASQKAVSLLGSITLEHYPEPQICLILGQSPLRVSSLDIEQVERKHGTSSITFLRALRLTYTFSIIVLATFLQRRIPK